VTAQRSRVTGGANAAGGTDAAVVVRGLTKRYGDRTVLDGISLVVEPGELVALLGPNGAGKTTTVEIIEGYRRSDGGTVRVLGVDPAHGGPALRARVGLMLQDGGIDPRAQPRETLVQYGRFHAEARSPDELLDVVGLGSVARTRYRRLSGGERQRLAFAIALVGRPEVLILDEPTAGMDPEARATTRTVIAEQRASGVAILLTSHDLGDVERMADHVCVLRDGRVIASGSPAELTAMVRPRLRFTVDRRIEDEQMVDLGRRLAKNAPTVSLIADPEGRRFMVDGVAPDAALVAALADWCATADRLLTEVRTTGATLEEAYLELVGGAATDAGEARG
jgi:ABC-2 type transport system ATP-binding protein